MTLRLDPEIAAILRSSPAQPALPVGDVTARRQRFAKSMNALAAVSPGSPEVAITTMTATASSEPPVPLRIYRPEGHERSNMAVVYAHGGGLISGSAADFDPIVSRYCAGARAAFLSVDYRLAPENPWPAAVQDVTVALRWALRAVADGGWGATRVIAMGDSAGAGLVASLTPQLGDEVQRIAAQVLIYPMLDSAVAYQAADPAISKLLTWSPDDERTGWEAALGSPTARGGGGRHAGAANEAAVVGLPQTYLEVGQLDLYAAPVVRFAQRLSGTGVATDLRFRAGLPHAFDVIAPHAAVTSQAYKDRISFLRRALAETTTR